MRLLGELPLRGAAQLEMKGRGCFWGSSRCAGLLDYRKKDAASGGSPAARGCSIRDERKRLLLGELPLRGAAGLQKERCGFWGISRCAGLLDYRKKDAASYLGNLPLRGAAQLATKGRGCFWGSCRCAGLLDYRKKDAASGGSPAARGCWITEIKMRLLRELPLRGLLDYRKKDAASYLGDLPLRGAAQLEMKGRGCFWGSSRCAGLLDYRKKDAASYLGDLPLRGAAQLETKGRGCFWGSCRCAGLLDYRKKDAASGRSPAARGCWITEIKMRLLRELPLRGLLDYRNKDAASYLGDLPLRGAAQLEMKGRGCFWGSSRCAGLLDYRERDTASGGASAARGCSMEGEGRLFLGEIQLREGGGAFNRARDHLLRGAAGLEKGRCGFWGSSRCAGLLDYRKKDAASYLGNLPLRGAAQLETKGRGCFWGSCRCAGLLDYRKKDAASGGSPAARGCWITEIKMRLLRELPLRGLLDYRKKDAASYLGDLPLRGAARWRERVGSFWGRFN